MLFHFINMLFLLITNEKVQCQRQPEINWGLLCFFVLLCFVFLKKYGSGGTIQLLTLLASLMGRVHPHIKRRLSGNPWKPGRWEEAFWFFWAHFSFFACTLKREVYHFVFGWFLGIFFVCDKPLGLGWE